MFVHTAVFFVPSSYIIVYIFFFFFFFSSRRRHTRFDCDWSSDVCSSDLADRLGAPTFSRSRAIPALVQHDRAVGIGSHAIESRVCARRAFGEKRAVAESVPPDTESRLDARNRAGKIHDGVTTLRIADCGLRIAD